MEATHDIGKIPGKSKTIEMTEHESLSEILPLIDVLYMTRIQRERLPDEQEYENVRGSYFIDAEHVSKMKKDAIVLHPLPRVDEIRPDVDSTPQARYFKQMQYGRDLRAALLSLILNP